MDNLETIAQKHLELMPEFPHLALAHVALALQGDDDALNRGDLESFLAWALSQPGVESEWGSTTTWLRFLCPRRYDHTKPSRDFTIIRRHFPTAAAVVEKVTAKQSQKKGISIFLDASYVARKTAAPSKRKLAAALLVGNELLGKLDEAGYDVSFFYEADKDSEVSVPPLNGVDVYLALDVTFYAAKVANIKVGEGQDGRYAYPLLTNFEELGMTIPPDAASNVPLADLPEAKYHLIIDYPLQPRSGGETENQAFAERYAAAVCAAIVAGDKSV